MSNDDKNKTDDAAEESAAESKSDEKKSEGLKGPRPYTRPIPADWWLKRGSYLAFMIREFTAIFVAAYVLLLLCMAYKFGQGAKEFNAFIQGFNSPFWYAFHGICLLASVFHTTTWFNVAPKALVIQIGEEKVPGVLVAAGHYAGWVGASAVMTWFMMGMPGWN